MNPKVSELKAAAKQKRAEAEKIFSDVIASGNEPSAEQEQRHDTLITEAEGLLTKAGEIEAREKRLNNLDAQLAASGGRAGSPMPHNDPANTRNGLHGYSILKALRQTDPKSKETLDGIELETHQELQKLRAQTGRPNEGTSIPWDLPVDCGRSRAFAAANNLERRDLTTSTGTGAIMTTTYPTMIEFLRNITLLSKLGMKVMTGMQGNFNLPRQSGTTTGYWIAPESATITKSNQTIDNVAFSPKTLGTQTVYSRAFLHQTSIDAEMFVREDLSLNMGVALDFAGFSGSGSGATPTGITNDPNVSVVAGGTNGAAPTWTLCAKLENVVEALNALNGSLNYVTSPNGRFTLKTTVKDSNTAGKYLWDVDTNSLNGYPAWSTNQISTALTKGSGTGLTALIFGDFTQIITAFWGGLDTIINPYTYSNAGAVEVTMLQDADIHLRHYQSFGVFKDMIHA